MYGYYISEIGIITNNYYKNANKYENPNSHGIYVLIRRNENIIKIDQDYYGSYGIYIYENKITGYFALSNSFILLVESLIGKQNMTLNKDFSDNLLISSLCSPSTYETLIKEIIKIPPNSYVIINIEQKKYEINYIDQRQNTIPFESEEGLKIIDKWVDKWGYILRSLKKQTDNISMDLSGGFDTRMVLSLLLNSGVNLNDILIKSMEGMKEDFKIATNISTILGFKLNENKFYNEGTLLDIKDAFDCSKYTKLGFHKVFHIKNKFFTKPIFSLTGGWGEMLRGYPNFQIQKYIESICGAIIIQGYEEEFYDSSKRILERSINNLKKEKIYNNDYELSTALYLRGRAINHFGKGSVESFLVNEYNLEPLSDPDLKKLKIDTNGKSFHDLIAYIYVRFSHNLISVPFQGKRILNDLSIQKAEKLNNKIPPYKVKSDYNKNFYIDNRRKSLLYQSKYSQNPDKYLKKIFKEKKIILNINKIYNKSVNNWTKGISPNYYPFRHIYSLLAIANIIEDISLNEKLLKK